MRTGDDKGPDPMDEHSKESCQTERRAIMKTGDVIAEGLFEGFEVIDTCSRAEAIADGILVDTTETAREAGIFFSVAITRSVWEEYVEPSSYDKEKWGQDLQGRLWDTIWMLRVAIRDRKQSEDRCTDPRKLPFEVYYRLRGHLRRIPLKALCGPGDNGSPVITIMLQDED
jgi:hypothetical protein